MRQLQAVLCSWYITWRYGRILHPVFGQLTLQHCIPEINMYWWAGTTVFPPTGEAISLSVHSPPTGPNDLQVQAYGKLIAKYDGLLAAGLAKEGRSPEERRLRLEMITVYIHGHLDLDFLRGGGTLQLCADAGANYLPVEVAALH